MRLVLLSGQRDNVGLKRSYANWKISGVSDLYDSRLDNVPI